jgi:probable HAF family extracellular repeat protein
MKYFSVPIILLAVFISLAKAEPSYTITDLGAGYPLALNNRGEVTGFQLNATGGGVLYSHGHIIALEGLPYGINDLGEVIGTFEGVPPAQYISHAFVYSHGRTIDITPTAYVAEGFDINDANQVVGDFRASPEADTSTTPGTGLRPFLLQYGHIIDVGKLVGSGNLVSINNRGQAVGFYYTSRGAQAFLYTNGRALDIAGLGPNSQASSINDHGQIAGTSSVGNNANIQHAFLSFGGSSIDLGTLPDTNTSVVRHINNSGVVVGECFQLQDNLIVLARPFIYSGGQLHDINTLLDPKSGWVFTYVESINDFDQIAGEGTLGSDTTVHALFLTPRKVDYCPEPR